MREVVLWSFVIFIGVAGAVISALPIIRWRRNRRRRKDVYDGFVRALEDGQLRATKFAREKAFEGAGFVDRLTGTAGTVPIVLSRRFRPFQKIDAFWLHVENETFSFSLDVEDDRHPIVRAYFRLRKRQPDAPSTEAN